MKNSQNIKKIILDRKSIIGILISIFAVYWAFKDFIFSELKKKNPFRRNIIPNISMRAQHDILQRRHFVLTESERKFQNGNGVGPDSTDKVLGFRALVGPVTNLLEGEG